MASPGTKALAIYRGDSYVWRFTLWNDTEATDPYDLTGVTPKAEIRAKSGLPVLAELDCTVTDPNIIDVILTAETSDTLVAGKAVWDLQLTNAVGEVRTVIAGAVTVTGDVTDSTAAAVLASRHR